MTWKRIVPIALLVALLSASSAMAQPDKPWKSVFGHFYGGVSLPQSTAADGLNDGWTLGGGATFKKEKWPVGIVVDLGYNDFSIDQSQLVKTDPATGQQTRIADSGSIDIWSLTGDLLWQPRIKGVVGFYLQAGVGAYYTQGRLTNSVVVPGWGCGWWYCAPGWWPANAVVGSDSSFDWGYNAGLGITFNLNNDSQIFLQAVYHVVEGDLNGEQYLPFVIGYRW